MTTDTPTTYRTAPLFAGMLPTTWRNTVGETARVAVAHHFDGVSDLSAFIPDECPYGAQSAGWDRSPDDARRRGTATMAQAKTLARDGWHEGAERAQALRAGILASMPTAPRLVRYDVAGAVPDVRRALAGNPASMKRTQIANTTARPVVTIVAQTAAPGGLDVANMENNAAAIAAVIDILEASGFRCELIAASRAVGTCSGTATGHETATRLKRAGDPLNLAEVAFGLGHPSYHRRMTFALRGADSLIRQFGSGMGRSVDMKPADCPPGTYLAPVCFGPGTEGATALALFLRACAALRDQGCPGIPSAEALADALTRPGAMARR